MRERRYRRISVRRPAILFAIVLALVITLTVLWNVVLAHDYNQMRELMGSGSFHTTFIVIGSALFLAIIVLSTIMGFQLLDSLRWSQRQSAFMASVSHELNSPLSSIKLFAQTLRQTDLGPEERARFAGKIIVDVDRLAHLFANILRAAEVDGRGYELPVELSEVDLRAYLEEYIENARVVYGERVELVLSGDPAWTEIDPIMFRQVLDNLIGNAIRYRGDRPARVELEVLRAGPQVELRVGDRGMGIPRGQLEHVFDRFYRIQKREPQTGARGIGIGLHVVRSIVLSHGGTVSASSPGPGKGTVIRIRLPAADPSENGA